MGIEIRGMTPLLQVFDMPASPAVPWLFLAQHLHGIQPRCTDGRRQRSNRSDGNYNQNHA
jgi:hypothetical protein